MLKKSNARRVWKRLDRFKQKFDKGEMTRAEVVQSLEGWLAYAEFANTYKFTKKVVARLNQLFSEVGNVPLFLFVRASCLVLAESIRPDKSMWRFPIR